MTVEAELGPYRLRVATDFGPRITGLSRDDGSEVFAQLGEDSAIQHEHGTFVFRGGHRLWVSPEIAETTYADDRDECQVEVDESQVIVTGATDPAGFEKNVRITLDGDQLVVDHEVIPPGAGSPVAAWGITQVPLGGTAIIPVVGLDTSPQANRFLVLWPYSRFQDDRVTLSDNEILLEAREGPPLKFGVGPDPRNLGYLREGELFVKQIEPVEGVVPDYGAAGQVYVGQGFCELESVGGLSDHPTLRERWTVRDCPDLETARQIMTELR